MELKGKGTIILNGIDYSNGGVGGATELVEMTKKEYDDLPDTKLTDGKQYFITDYTEADGGGGEDGRIGNMANLETTNKNTVVEAINEVLTDVNGEIGDLEQLETTSKNDLVSAINELNSKGISTLSGTVTRNSSYVSGGGCYWIKVGKIVLVWGYDISFNVVSKTWEGATVDNYILSGLPKKSIKNSVFMMDNFDGSTKVRCQILNSSTDARICPHWCTTPKNTNNYYFLCVYESES